MLQRSGVELQYLAPYQVQARIQQLEDVVANIALETARARGYGVARRFDYSGRTTGGIATSEPERRGQKGPEPFR